MDILLDFFIGCYAGAIVEKYQGIDYGYFGVGRPIYGLGALFATKSVWKNLLIYSVLEYLGSYIFDPDKNLWDYSAEAFNLNGRICLKNSIEFAGLGLLYRYIPKPLLVLVIILLYGGFYANNTTYIK